MALKKSNTTAPDEAQSSQRDCSEISQDLISEDPSKRRWAARDIVSCEHASVMLLDQLEAEKDISVKLSARSQEYLFPCPRCGIDPLSNHVYG